MKRRIIAGVSSLALIAGMVTAAVSPASADQVRLPKTAMLPCSVQNSATCIESVSIKQGGGPVTPLVWVNKGADVPQAVAVKDFFAPVARVENGKVTDNNWWMSQYQRDVLTSGTYTMQDLSSLLGTPNHPEQGAKYDPTTKTFDITKPMESYSYPQECWNPTTQKSEKKTFGECFKGSLAFIVDDEVKFFFFYPTVTDVAKEMTKFKAAKFIDLAKLSELQQRPVLGTTYDATAGTFGAVEGMIIPLWVSNNALVNGWAVAGTAAAAPAEAPATATDSATVEAGVAPLAPDPGVGVGTPAEKGVRAFSGRWTLPNWQALNLGALGYDGLYVDAKTPNEFVSSMLFIDVIPTLTGADKLPYLAGQVGNNKYAVSMDADLVISVKVRVANMQTGVTVAVGTDITTQQQGGPEYNSVVVTGSPVTVPLAAATKDCTGEAGISKANIRQFQAIILAANDDTSGFGVEGTSGGMYVGSNGVCELSTPVWNAEEKSFSWKAAAPHFAPDGVTVNKGFYKAVIPTQDAALLWGLTNPNDAATALDISITTEAGGSAAALKSVSVKNGKIIIDVSGFSYSRPKLKIAIKAGYKPTKASVKKSTITCVSGKTVKKITAVNPTCPKGYKKK